MEKSLETEAQILRRVLAQPIRLTVNGETRVVTVWEAICQVLVNDAEKDDPVAVRLVWQLAEIFGWLKMPQAQHEFVVWLEG